MQKVLIAAVTASLFAGGLALGSSGGGSDSVSTTESTPSTTTESTTTESTPSTTTGTATTETQTTTTRTNDDATRTTDDATRTNDDARKRTRTVGQGVDISGPCDEAEHANDPRCAPGAPTRDDRGDRGGHREDETERDDDDSSGPGSDNSGPGSDNSGLARPLRRLASTARRVAGGDLSARAEVSGSREQRETAVAFNDMTDRLGRALASQQEFAGNASHQLRTPLTGLRLRLEAATMRAEDPQLREELAAGEKEAERLSEIVRDLLALARDGEQPHAGTTVDIAVVARAARARWAEVAGQRGSEIELRGPESLGAWGSEADLGVICDNLVDNALAHSPPGAPVVIEWGEIEGDRSRDPWLAVLDEGPGLDPAETEHVFERFYRGAASARSGSGLGLAVVRTLARRWGGDASIENREAPGGARAVVTLQPARESLPAAGVNGRSEAKA